MSSAGQLISELTIQKDVVLADYTPADTTQRFYNKGGVLFWGAVPLTGTGSVTGFSAADLVPLFTSSVSTATTTPALTFTLKTVAANKVLAGPVSGSDAAWAARALVLADIPDLSGTYQAALGYSPENVANKNTSGALGASDVLYPSQKAVKTYCDTKEPALGNPSADGYVLSSTMAGVRSWVAGGGGPGGSGTVTSVASGTGLTGGPITTSGTLSLAAIANNTVLGNISGSSAAPSALTSIVLPDNLFVGNAVDPTRATTGNGGTAGAFNQIRHTFTAEYSTESYSNLFDVHAIANYTPSTMTHFNGAVVYADTAAGMTAGLTNLAGAYGIARHYGSGNIAMYLVGLLGQACSYSSGSVNQAWGIAGGYLNAGAGTMTNAYAILAQNLSALSTGPITNAYGVYIDDQTYAGATNVWQLYSAGNKPSYFAGSIQSLLQGINVAPDATRAIVANGNVRASDQSGAVTCTFVTGASTSARLMFHAENATVFTPTVTADSSLAGFFAAPRMAATATTFFNTASGLVAYPQMVSSDSGARVALAGVSVYAVRNMAADTSTYSANSLTGVSAWAGHYLGTGASIVSGTVTCFYARPVAINGFITTLYGIDVASPYIGLPGQNPNVVVTTYYGLRLEAPGFYNGGTITNEYGISQDSTTALNKFAGTMRFSYYGAGVLSVDGSGNLASNAAVGSSGLTMTSSRLLGRWTAATGVVQEVQVGSNLTLTAGGFLNASAASATLDARDIWFYE